MIKAPITVTVDTEIDDAVRVIYYNKIGGLPVVDEGQRLLIGLPHANQIGHSLEAIVFLEGPFPPLLGLRQSEGRLLG